MCRKHIRPHKNAVVIFPSDHGDLDEQTGTGTQVSDYVELDLGKVKPGRYMLRMDVRDLNSEQTTTREGVFRVVGSAQ